MRIDKLRPQFDDLGIDALGVSQPENRRYLSGFTGSSGVLLITRDQALLLTDSRYWEQVARQAPDWELVKMSGPWAAAIKEPIERLGLRRVGFEAQDVTVDLHERLSQATNGAVEWVPTRSLVEKLRWVKEPGELEALRRAIALTDDAFHWLTSWLTPGVSERAVAWELEKYMRERGASGLSFESIIASGPNAALPHARPSDRVIQAGEPITIDMGAIVDEYHADMTRTVCLGEPDEQFRSISGIVLDAVLAAERGLKVGMSGKEADGLARAVIEAAGYGENFGHSLGHGVGLATHEGPTLSPRAADDGLPEGITVTIEPGIYLPGWGGVRIEDVVRLGPDGAEVLTRASREPRIALDSAGATGRAA